MVKTMEATVKKWKVMKDEWYTYQNIADLYGMSINKVYKDLKKNNFKTIVALYDIHIPYQDDECLAPVFSFIKKCKPDEIILWWDVIDCEWISRFFKWEPEVGIMETLREIDQLKTFVKKLKSLSWASRIIYLYWNHEQRAVEKLAEFPDMKDYIDIPIQLWDLVDEYHGYNSYYKVWNLHYIHWTYHNDAHAKKHALMYQRSVRYWHLHSSQEYCLGTPVWDEVISSKSVPCLCSKDPSYMKNRPSPWLHWFNVAYINEDWTFSDYNIIINKWTFVFNWERYE